MDTSVAKAEASAEINSVDLRMTKASLTRQPPSTAGDDDGSWAPSLFAEAAKAVSKQEAVATAMRLDPAQFSRQCKGDGHLSMKRAGLADKDVWREFARRILAETGEVDPVEEAFRRVRQAMDALGSVVEAFGRLER